MTLAYLLDGPFVSIGYIDLLFQFETIAEGCILCLGEEDPAEDTSPEITSKVDQPSDLSSSDNPGSEVSSIKSKCIMEQILVNKIEFILSDLIFIK